MKLLLDQMLDEDVAAALRAEGYDAVRVSAFDMQRAHDDEILNKAIGLDRVLITLDDDFGDWAVLPLGRHSGVIRIRANPTSSDRILPVLLTFLKQRHTTSFRDHLVIVKRHHARWIKTA